MMKQSPSLSLCPCLSPTRRQTPFSHPSLFSAVAAAAACLFHPQRSP
ncbi:hypothetical protein ACKVWC_011587 [Pyricularia oryzae]